MFKDSLDEVEYRRPVYRTHTLRQRTVSDQPREHDLQLSAMPSTRRLTNDMAMSSFKNQIKDVDAKVEKLFKKIDDLSKSIVALKLSLNYSQVNHK